MDQQTTPAGTPPGTVPERMAPGHCYNPATGTGIEWQPQIAHLWEGGRITAPAKHGTLHPWEFWYYFAFADSFPDVSHWWFGSAWTGRLWLWPAGVSADGNTESGWMQFVDRRTPPLPWQITLGQPVQVATPLPPFEVNAINLPLRRVLAQTILDLHTGDVPAAPPATDAEGDPAANLDSIPGTLWVTSLVPRAELAAAFPAEVGPWRLEHVDQPLRKALCTLQGLDFPTKRV